MSNSSPTDGPLEYGDLPSAPVGPVVRQPLARVAFWTAIALPFLYIPLLAAGLGTATHQVAFVVLLALNVVTLLVGHSHRSD